MTAPIKIQRRVLWGQVWGLALVQGAIALTWVIYNLYLVALLTRFGFPESLAVGLLIIENLLAMVMEPLMGSLSDRVQQWIGSRFLLVALGIILAAAAFVAIPLMVLRVQVAWLLPLIMVLWALAMTVFRSPAMSLLGQYAFATRLPQAASILTLVGGLAGAMGPLASDIILGMGPLVAFSLGSGTLLLAALALQLSQPGQRVGSTAQASSFGGNIDLPKLGLVFGAGVGVGLGFRLLMAAFPAALAERLSATPPSIIMGLLFISLAATAVPAGILALRWGNRLAMIGGLGGMTCFCLLIGVVHHGLVAAALAIALGAAFSLVSNGTIPFALSMVPPHKHGLGTGLYFSGGALASSLFGFWLNQGLTISPGWGGVVGGLAFLGAAGCVSLGKSGL